MVKKYRGIIILLFGVIILINIISKDVFASLYYGENRSFNRIELEDGLSQTTINTIFQDSKGYIWIATIDGLNRYNGHEFKVYKYKENDSNTISGNRIEDIKEDLDGNIWVATNTGLNKINTTTDNIQRYLAAGNEGDISNYKVRKILIATNGDILVGTYDGLNIYDKQNDNFKRIYNSENEDLSLSSQEICALEEDGEGNYWIGTVWGLNKIEKEGNKISKFYLDENDESTISSNHMLSLHSDDRGYLWIGTNYGGLNRLELQTGIIKRYDKGGEEELPDSQIKDILRDSRGLLWIATGGGLVNFDEANNKFITYKSNRYNTKSIISDNILSLYEDTSGSIWIGTYEGISLFNPDNLFNYYKQDPLNSNSLSGNDISGIYEDDEGILWIGTNNNGLNIFDRKSNKVTRVDVIEDYQGEFTIASNSVREITGIDDEIWIATPAGLVEYNKSTLRWKIYNKDSGLLNDDIKVLHIDSEGFVWAGTYNGLFIVDRNGNFIDYTELLLEHGIENPHFSDIYQDHNGKVWLSMGREYGLISIDPKTNEFKRHIAKDLVRGYDYISSITSEKNGNIWLSTANGLIKFNEEREEFVRYTEDEGLPNNFIYGALIDNNDNIWVSTNYGISKFDTLKNKFINYDSTDGIQGNEFNQYSYFKGRDNELFFGGTNGLTSFIPDNIREHDYQISVQIESIVSNYGNVCLEENITLNHKNNQLQFKFFIPNYGDANRIMYGYKLVGLESEWTLSKGVNTVNYTNLKPGNYQFQVIGKNSNGLWSDISSVNINIKNPLWKTPIAFYLYAVTIIGVTLLIWNRVKILDGLVKQRTAELDNKLKENEELYTKLLHQEKYKNNYFINLSHELRTPLNIISSTQNLIESLNQQNIQISQTKMSYYMQTIKKNCGRLMNLIDNIIYTSKIESGHYKLIIEEQDIVYLVEEVALSMKDFIEERGINLIIEPYVEEKVINCDKLEIERVIINLLSNAMKFTKENGTIEVFIWDLGECVKISVKDNGIGIEEKYHETIFNRFSQAYSDTTEEHGGSGLGLTLSRQLIELHGGDMWVESELGEGSEFIIIIPSK